MAFWWYQHWAEREPEHTAIEAADETVSFGDLQRRVSETAVLLQDSGVSRSTRLVFSFAPDSIQGIVALLATLSLSAQAVLPDFDWEENDFLPNLAPFANCHLLKTAPGGVLVVEPGDCTHLPPAGAEGGGIWLYTSGTTSRPRPWFRPFALLSDNVERVRNRLPKPLADSRPNSLCVLPLYHGYGLINSLFLVHSLGGSVFLADGADPAAIVGAIHKHNIRILYAWPVQFTALADADLWHAGKDTDLRWCVSSSYRLEPETARRFEQITGCALRQQYGMTETGPLSVDSDSAGASAPPCVGHPVEGVEIRILNREDKILGPGREGRIAIRVKNQWLPPDTLLIDGFWPNGDIGALDENGRLLLLRRALPFSDERSRYS